MNTSNPEVLIQDLIHNARASGNKPLEQRLSDLTVWFYRGKTRISPENLPMKTAFLEKSLWILLEVNALLVERCHELEVARKGRTKLWLPSGARVNGHEFS